MKRACSRRSRTCAGIAAAVLTLSMLVALMGCASSASRTDKAAKLELIAAAPDGNGFVERDSGRQFIPFGVNYYDPNTDWPPQVWRKFDPNHIEVHFKFMRLIGVNCARVFLTAGSFQPDVNTVDPQALAKLDRLIKIARQCGIRLILTGPDHWEGSPQYWKPDQYAGEQAVKALEHFWTVVGQRYRDEPAIFAWDLRNEPEMPWFVETWRPRWNDWLRERYVDRAGLKAAWAAELAEDEQLGSIEVPKDTAVKGNPRLLDWQRFREHLADEWVRRQVEALRAADPSHLITVGYIQWSYPPARPGDPHVYCAFNPHRQKQWLDFISIHFYPLMGEPYSSRDSWEKNLAYLQSVLAYCHTGKPVVLSEFGWYGGGAPAGRPYLTDGQQARWIGEEIEASRRLAHGWLSWAFADTPEATDMSIYGGLVGADMHLKWWTRWFQVYAANLAVLPQPTPELPVVDFTESLTTPVNELLAIHDAYAQRVQAAVEQAGPMPVIKMPEMPVFGE